jgi:hypothetical protein
MEVSFTLWSMRDVLKKIPFGVPTEEAVHLDFSEMAVPYYVKNGFKVSIFYVDDSFPVDAVCSIYSPKTVVTIIILIKQKFEEALRRWKLDSNGNDFILCCRRRELYCHETSHLIAIIRAFPSNRSSKVRQDFIDKLKTKFEKSISSAESSMATPLISAEKSDDSPSVFDKDHFRYEGDDLNYFRLYDELMLDYDTMRTTLKSICDTGKEVIYLEDISRVTLVPTYFFQIFSDKITILKEILIEILKEGLD